MEISEQLEAGFETVNVFLSPTILEKCIELCTVYKLDVEDFIDQWLAYTASNLNGAAPSIDALCKMERRELAKQSTKTPKVENSVSSGRTPVMSNVRVEAPKASPTVDIPLVTSSQFDQRSGALEVQVSFGTPRASLFVDRFSDNITIQIQNKGIMADKFMYDKCVAKRNAVNSITCMVVHDILIQNNLTPTRENLSQYFGDMIVCGRIYSDTSGKVTEQSLFLEGIVELYKGRTIRMAVHKLGTLFLFSGQCVVVKGNNVNNVLVVNTIFHKCPLTYPPLHLKHTLQVMVAAGPFTLSDNLSYEPLKQFLEYVIEFKPNVLILMGPFLEESHPLLENSSECYDLLFENVVDGIMEKLKESSIQVVIIPSHKDLHGHHIFPSLPYNIRKQYNNLTMAPNPCMLDIEGLLLGASSADILFHLSKAELCRKKNQTESNRLGRLASYVFDQRSFYPLYPPDSEIRIDYQLLEKGAMFADSPHIMILPSKFRHFVKRVDNCVVINPERLVNGGVAGNFARIEVRPGGGSIQELISCEILRV